MIGHKVEKAHTTLTLVVGGKGWVITEVPEKFKLQVQVSDEKAVWVYVDSRTYDAAVKSGEYNEEV